MKIITLLILFLFINTVASTQSVSDSLKNIIREESISDSIKTEVANRLSSFNIGKNRDTAEYYNRLAIQFAERSNYQKELIGAKLAEISIFVNDWELDTIKTLADDLLHIAERNGYSEIQLSALITLGAMHTNRGLHDEGIVYYLKALPIAEELKNYEQLGKIQFNLGVVYYNIGIHEKAVNSFKGAASYFKKANIINFEALSVNAVANSFNNMEELDSALFYSNTLIRIADSIQYTKLQLEARTTIGAIHINKAEYNEANKFFLEALPYAEKVKSTLLLANCYCNLGRANYFLENYTEALNYLNKAYSYDIFTDNNLANQFCLKEMALVQARIGNSKKANEYFEQYINYQDSVLIKENKLVITELEEKYETAVKDQEIKTQEAEINKKTYQRNMLFGGLGLVLLLGGTLFWGLFSRSKRNKLIADQEKELQQQKIRTLEKEKKLLSMSYLLEGQETERIRIAKDLHDGLGGLLTTVKAHFGKIQSEIEKVENLDIYNTANEMIDKAHEEVRRISHNLMPGDLRAGGLPVAVSKLVQN